MDAFITASRLKSELASTQPPLLIDVRRPLAFRAALDMAAGALRRDPGVVAEWAKTLPRAASVVTYCVHGHEVSQNAAKALRDLGIAARYLEGGLEEGWKAARGELVAKPREASTRWVTRERPKIDRIACPWLVARFVDPEAEFLYVPSRDVLRAAEEREAIPYDVPDVRFSHDGELLQLRRVSEGLPINERSGVGPARPYRARRRYRTSGAGAPGTRTPGALARPVAQLQGRSRDVEARVGDVRRALRLVQGRTGRDAHLEGYCLIMPIRFRISVCARYSCQSSPRSWSPGR